MEFIKLPERLEKLIKHKQDLKLIENIQNLKKITEDYKELVEKANALELVINNDTDALEYSDIRQEAEETLANIIAEINGL